MWLCLCVQDLKQRLIDQANLVQSRFERETSDLQKKEKWYQEHQVNLSKQDEEEYLNFCREAMFRIHILEQRLKRYTLYYQPSLLTTLSTLHPILLHY